MKTFSVAMALVALLLLLIPTPLWAGSSRTVAVSCVVLPRVSVEMAKGSESPSQGRLLEKKEIRVKNLSPLYERAVIYSYCER